MIDVQNAHNCVDIRHRVILCIYILIVTFLNSLLLHFIRCKTSECMKDYKMILYMTTVIDFVSAWLQFLIGIVRFLINFFIRILILETNIGK